MTFFASPRWTKCLVMACTGLLGSCREGAKVSLQLVHSPDFVPTTAAAATNIRFLEVESAQQILAIELPNGFTGSSKLGSLEALAEGRRYLVEVESQAPSACTGGIAVGKSLPFEHSSEPYSIALSFGCTDAFATTAGRPQKPRLGHSVVASPEGAVLVGGAASYQLIGQSLPSAAEASWETYQLATGEFVATGSLNVPRAFAATLAVAENNVAVIGGQTVGNRAQTCSNAVERISAGTSLSTGAALTEGRCHAAAAYLPSLAETWILGGEVERGERYDAAAQRRNATFAHAGIRNAPAVVPLADGGSVLVVGGNGADGSPLVEHLSLGSSCTDGVCRRSIAVAQGPSEGWQTMTATYVGCESGGGVVYVVGGATGEMQSEIALDGIWCLADRPGVELSLSKVGALASARRMHRTVTVRGGALGHRLLAIGGTPSGQNSVGNAHDDAVLIDVPSCECSPLPAAAMTLVPLPWAGQAVLHDASVLADGSVLLVGGASLPPMSLSTFQATGEAALFIPAL